MYKAKTTFSPQQLGACFDSSCPTRADATSLRAARCVVLGLGGLACYSFVLLHTFADWQVGVEPKMPPSDMPGGTQSASVVMERRGERLIEASAVPPLPAPAVPTALPPPSASPRRARRRVRLRPPPPPPWREGTAWYDKHFPRMDGPPEKFRTSSEVNGRVSRGMAGRLRRSPEPFRLNLRSRRDGDASDSDGARPQAWDAKDRWWRAVSELHRECARLSTKYGIPPGATADERLPERLHARWQEYDCGPS